MKFASYNLFLLFVLLIKTFVVSRSIEDLDVNDGEEGKTDSSLKDETIDHMEWIEWNNTYIDNIPPNAVSLKNPDGEIFLVGRIKYLYGYRIGYVELKKHRLNIPSKDVSIGYNDSFQILIGPSDQFYWKKINKNTKLNDGHHIVVGGNDENGNELGVAKCNYDDMYFFGEINLNSLDYAIYTYHTQYLNSMEYHCYNFKALIYMDKPEDSLEIVDDEPIPSSVEKLEWIKWDGKIPDGAISIKNNPNGKSFLVGRVPYNGGIHIGYVDINTTDMKLFFSYGGKVYVNKYDFEVLVGPSDHLYWKKLYRRDYKLNSNEEIVIGGREKKL